MANRYTGLQQLARRQRRLEWLQANTQVLAGLPAADEDVSPAGRETLERVLQRMMRLGLYSQTSEKKASRWGIRILVSELRGRPLPPTSMGRYRS